MTYDEWMPSLVAGLGFTRLERIPGTRPRPSDFARLEARIGGTLPGDYRYFLERWGGGYFGNRECFAVATISEPCPWGRNVSPETWHPLLDINGSIEAMMDAYQGRIPGGTLPCADDAFGNAICLDVAGGCPGSVWFWDHEQRWFAENYPDSIEDAAREVDRSGIDARRFSVHDIIRAWARLHAARWDRPPDYMGMYRMASSFREFLHSLRSVRYDSITHDPD